jgi:hypothetical protein
MNGEFEPQGGILQWRGLPAPQVVRHSTRGALPARTKEHQIKSKLNRPGLGSAGT